MTPSAEPIIVGVLGQWASGKSEAARTLVRHLGGERAVIFLSDRALFASRAIDHIREQGASPPFSLETDGRRRYDRDVISVWLNPGEDLETVDPNTLRFYVPARIAFSWINRARLALGRNISHLSAEGCPMVIEAGFGAPVADSGDPIPHTLSDLFARLAESNVRPSQAGWIVIEASFARRAERNRRRPDAVPPDFFERYASDGGDLSPGEQRKLEAQGARFARVPNDHDDIERFRSGIIAAFEAMFGRGPQVR